LFEPRGFIIKIKIKKEEISFFPSTIMSDDSSDVSARWNNLLDSIDIKPRTQPSETGQSDSSDVSAQWNSLLATIDTPGKP
jgi:hypothetical protein